MTAGLLILIVCFTIFWLVFFKFRLLRLTPAWGLVFGLVVLHLLLIFVIGLRFVTPNSTNATVVQHTIQLIPRLPEPTLVTAVLVEENTPVKKGQPLFQFDRRPYEYKVQQLEAQLAEAKQNVKVLKLDVAVAAQDATKTKVDLEFQQYQKRMFDKLAEEQAVREDLVEQWLSRVNSAQATNDAAEAALERAQVRYKSEIEGVNTTVANVEAQLRLAQYYLDNTTLAAPEDGRILNLQVRPGMVSGIVRIGGIAALIAEADRYVLATFFQENLKYVRPGQPVEVSFDLYPGQIFSGKVDSIWRGNGVGQYLPSDEIPKFQQPAPNVPQGQYAVKLLLDGTNQPEFPIGAQGTAAIYTSGEYGAWAALRKISIRTHSWLNWFYPINF
ncbi:HlyD family secretion protein [Bradyrhizobium sp. 2]|uniref:HlyD family secretion protein n=1 Tax=unclassified Bradyrhizobium TaxID=2631580 RepID=UPI001FFA2106|nr:MULTISPECIES: biotin/lipoyl-binding protein [unclassified Bradyrhizobium]MCK1448813.1 HlyD family secretion protein [Bradyrhizobium sp. 48]MCK1465499.1 HlyD family secretion protein [Bradyrhizobium sp. 2]